MYREKIVHIASEDGFKLAGAQLMPDEPKAALLWIHAISMGFAEPEYLEVGRKLADLGIAFFTVETRGHNFGAWLRGPGLSKLGGSAWELLWECPADLSQWIRYIRQATDAPLVLCGHGWGASKLAYYVAERGSDGAIGLALISSGSVVRDPLPPELVAQAEAMVEAGHGKDLMPWGVRPGLAPSTVSAEVYAARSRLKREFYGDGFMRPALSRVALPILATYGGREGRPRGETRRLIELIERNATSAPSIKTVLLRGASFLYTGSETKLAQVLKEWLEDLLGRTLDGDDDKGSPAR